MPAASVPYPLDIEKVSGMSSKDAGEHPVRGCTADRPAEAPRAARDGQAQRRPSRAAGHPGRLGAARRSCHRAKPGGARRRHHPDAVGGRSARALSHRRAVARARRDRVRAATQRDRSPFRQQRDRERSRPRPLRRDRRLDAPAAAIERCPSHLAAARVSDHFGGDVVVSARSVAGVGRAGGRGADLFARRLVAHAGQRAAPAVADLRLVLAARAVGPGLVVRFAARAAARGIAPRPLRGLELSRSLGSGICHRRAGARRHRRRPLRPCGARRRRDFRRHTFLPMPSCC